MTINPIVIKSIEPYKEYIYNYKYPLLGFNSSSKVLKGFKLKDYTTGILYLQPADSVAMKTLCPFAVTAGCLDECLGKKSGRLAMNQSQLAMTRRTIQYLRDPDYFKERLRFEILKNERTNYCIRLNGTSDIDWSDLISTLPNIQFYDYSKVLTRVKRNKLSNYHLTYSASFKNKKCVKNFVDAIQSGVNTVIAFNTKESSGEFKIPKSITVHGKQIKLVSFDDTDLRFLDKDGAVGSLKRKGSQKKTRLSEIGTPNFFADLINIQCVA